MIVSNAVSIAFNSDSSVALDSVPLGALDVCPLDVVTDSQVGISPASAVIVKAQVKAIAAKNRFIDVSPFFEVKAIQSFLHRDE